MKKGKNPSVYVDTNILSVLHQHGKDPAVIAQQIATRDWWDHERKFFELCGSIRTEEELASGSYDGQDAALAAVRRLRFLPSTAQVKSCARLYLEAGVVPSSTPGDAIQLAFATIHVIDYLLTWNQTHLLNLETQKRLTALNERNGWRTPLLVSPHSIPKVRLGETIRRKP